MLPHNVMNDIVLLCNHRFRVIAGVVAQQACVLAFLHGILCQRATNGGKGNAEISLLFFSTSSEDC